LSLLSVCFLCGSCGPLCGSLRGLLWSSFRSAFMRHSFSVICLSFAASAAVLSHIYIGPAGQCDQRWPRDRAGRHIHFDARPCCTLTFCSNICKEILRCADCPRRVDYVCVCSVWVPCVALPSGGGSSVGPSPLCGFPLWVPCVGPLCGSPVWVPCVGTSARCVPCGIYSRDVSRSFTRSRSD